MATQTTKVEVEAPGAPKRFVFVLLENFTLLSFASAVDSLRIANRMAGLTLYEWFITGDADDEGMVSCSSGSRFKVDGPLCELNRDDVVLICGGSDVQKSTTKKLLNWVRREARRGLRMGGLCTASFTLARAGLLDGKRATIHWENHDSFAEEFEEVTLTKSVYVIDGNRLSTAGGASSLDLMLRLISDH